MERTFDYVVVGGGCGGVDVAFHLRRLDPDASVALVNPHPHLVFRPWLIYLPVGRLTEDRTQVDLRPFAARWRLELVVGAVDSVDTRERRLVLAGGARLGYGQLAITTGAVSDRRLIPGGEAHAIFPCDTEQALELSRRFRELDRGVVTVILAGERPGPGLEYAGWMASTLAARPGPRRVRLQVVDHEDTAARQLGARATRVLQRWTSGWDATFVAGERVAAVGPGCVELAGGGQLESAVTAIVGPLRGAGPSLPADLTDAHGFVVSDECLRSRAEGVFAAGDVVALGAGRELPKSWEITRIQAEGAARNMVAARRGGETTPFDARRARRLAFNTPNFGGRTVMARNGRLLVAGRLPLKLKTRMERRYLAERFS
ncbi:MAG TPA: FAD-dependent oxidoreductase [Candidatus Eisenbacteria bacterium]|nr:FAD-dependent oxidoreductase [Candidatus Eisenbacteria bacterium]